MGDQNTDYANVIETLFITFSGVLERDVIASVVESFEGDLEQSANALMNITGDLNPANSAQSSHDNAHPINNVPTTQNHCPQNEQPAMSYAHASQFIAQGPTNPTPPPQNKFKYMPWGDETREIITNYNNGWRILVLMRGAPGSGKSFLAQEILRITVGVVKNNQQHIMSADDFFFYRGVYKYNKSRLSDAHTWNQRRAREAMEQGVSPVIIDNTHIDVWEMDPYVKAALNNGYIITVVEPHTPWAKKAHQLCRRNIHNVPLSTIQRMLDNYKGDITGKLLVRRCGEYAANFTPPILRKYPPLPQTLENTISKTVATLDSNAPIENIKANNNDSNAYIISSNNKPNEKLTAENSISEIIAIAEKETDVHIKSPTGSVPSHFNTKLQTSVDKKLENNLTMLHLISTNIQSLSDDMVTTDKSVGDSEIISECTDNEQTASRNANYAEVEKCFEEFEQVERAWDNGETWEEEWEEVSNPVLCEPAVSTSSKPQRDKVTLTKELHISSSPTEDWSKLYVFPEDWSKLSVCPSNSKFPINTELIIPVTNKKSSSTCFEIGDTDFDNIKNPRKVITAVSRNINLFVPAKIEKIPDQRMLDKSTSTSDEIISIEPMWCPNAEQHFKALRKFFRHIASTDLRDIFEKCCGDVNWAVGIIFDGMENKQFRIKEEDDLSEDEDNIDNIDQCPCLAAYNIIPDNRPSLTEKPIPIIEKLIAEDVIPIASPKKIRKETVISDASIQMKRQIEKTVVISDNHYSEHCLKIRNFKRGDKDCSEDTSANNEDKISDVFNINRSSHDSSENKEIYEPPIDLPSTSGKMSEEKDDDQSDFDDDDCLGIVERTVNIAIGSEFINQLDKLFGREDLKYPDNVLPNINVPMSLLNEINALWMESLMHQLEQDTKQTKDMIQQDAEFARELEKKEEEMALAGKASHLPDFKEIMDMDLALSLYQKDVEQWRINEPLDLASKLTRDKLFNLFPHLPKDVLSEILMAHNNDFQETVEGVLMSSGRNDILKEKNGVKRFIMNQELEIKQKYIQEQRKTLSEDEWPSLPRNSDLGMEDVNNFRAEATRQFMLREKSYQKAKEYLRRGIMPAASFFYSTGAYHTKLFEQANSKAAITLAEVNAQNCKNDVTLDLHHFRVCESMETLDLFLDMHIHRLRQTGSINRARDLKLFLITGRGLHSPGGPKIKPATKKRLHERGVSFYELNPGLLATKVTPHHKLSDEIA